MKNATGPAPFAQHDGDDGLEVMRRLTGRPVVHDRQWADAVLAGLSRLIDDPRIVRRDPHQRPVPGAPACSPPAGAGT